MCSFKNALGAYNVPGDVLKFHQVLLTLGVRTVDYIGRDLVDLAGLDILLTGIPQLV